jgi:hypothetical protein
LNTLNDIMADVPDPLRDIYESVYRIGEARSLDPDETDVPATLRATLDTARKAYLQGGWKLEAHHFDALLDLHQMLREQGQPGIALLLAKLLLRLTSIFPGNGGRRESVMRMVAEDTEWIVDMLENGAAPWLENVLLALDLKPEMLLLARDVGRVVLSGNGSDAETAPSTTDAPSGREHPLSLPGVVPLGLSVPTEPSRDGTSMPLVLRLAQYELLLRDPAIAFLRSVFRAHAEEDGNPAAVLPGGGEAAGELAEFDVAYFRSQFIPLAIESNPWGGRDITLLFRDRPDRLFTAWIHGDSSDDLVLRSFRDAGVPSTVIEEVLQYELFRAVLAREPLCA